MNNIIDEIMPEMLIGEDLNEALKILPDYNPEIRQKGKAERLIALQDIYQVFIPTKMSQEIYSKLYLSLMQSLKKKQTIQSVRQSYENKKIIKQQTYESIIGGSDSFSIIGQSGIGKSSSVSRSIRLLSNRPYIEIDNTRIIPCLTIQAPADASLKGLLFEIIRKVDDIIETNYYYNAQRTRATVDVLIGSISQIGLNHVGVIVIDEIQNIVNSKNGKVIVGVLTQLINNSGVSICMIGTPESTLFFDQNMILARRSIGLKYEPMTYGDDFKKICKELLRYCYVHNDAVIDEALYMWLFNHSGGNASIVVSLIHDAQELSILENTERLDISSLSEAFERRLSMLHSYITVPRMKAKPIKKTSTSPKETKRVDAAEDVSVYDILMAAKANNVDPIKALLSNNISIKEVSI